MIVKYKSFLYQSLFESVLVGTPDFVDILRIMSDHDSIANKVWRFMVRGNDIQTNYNAVGLSDKNDEVSCIPDSQYQRYLAGGVDPWTKNKSKSKIGRMVRQIITDNGESVSDSEIEKFVNKFKSMWDKKHGVNKKIEIVSGEKILYWYDQQNYDQPDGGGQLGNSCMRFTTRNHFMKIYAENPDKISMVVLTDENKLIGRAILWKLDSSTRGYKYYMDRIYTSNDSDRIYMYEWTLQSVGNGSKEILGSYQGVTGDLSVNLNKVEFDRYPYADTLAILYKELVNNKILDKGFISNIQHESLYDKYIAFYLQETNGGSICLSHQYSTYLDIYIKITDAIFVDYLQSYVYKKDTKYCTSKGSYYLKTDVVYSEAMADWIPKNKSIDHPKYGVILEEYLIDVVTEYKDSGKDPIQILTELVDDRNTSDFKTIECLKNSGNYIKLNLLKDRVSNLNFYFDGKLVVDDMNDNSQPYFLCYKLYRIRNIGDIDQNIIGMLMMHNRRYITEVDAKFFNIDVDDFTFYIYCIDFVNYLNDDFYSNYKNSENAFDVSDEIKDKKDKMMNAAHTYLYNHNVEYKTKYLFKEKCKNPSEELFELCKISVNKYLLNNDVKPKFYNYFNSNEYSDDIIEIFIKLLPLYTFFYIICEDSTDSADYVDDYMNHEYPDINTNLSDYYSRYRKVYYHLLRDDIKDIMISELESSKLSSEGLSPMDIISEFRRVVNIKSAYKFEVNLN